MATRSPAWMELFASFREFFKLLPQLLDLLPILRRMHAALCRWIHDRRSHRRGGCCIDIPSTEYKRPDPMLYSQTFLMNMGMAVTWDNPDIQLYDNGVPVSSNNLLANHDYEVVVRVWNNSYDAPAANLPVILSYLDFGVGTTPIFINKVLIDLGAKGSSQCPAFAKFVWHTPGTSGHYCLQAYLQWVDDANPDNNLGQENTNVGLMQSPAIFTFKVKNAVGVPRRYQLEADMYSLPRRDACPADSDKREKHRMTRLQESKLRWEKTLKEQGYGLFPVSSDWNVKIEPSEFSLAAGEETDVHVNIEYLPGNFQGQQAFNINAFASTAQQKHLLVGGVTLVAKGGN